MNDYVPPTLLWISEIGDNIVPGSALNAIRYQWSAGALPTNVSAEITNCSGHTVRTFSGLPSSYTAGKKYAEAVWNGCKDSTGSMPLVEEESPYHVRVKATFGQSHLVSDPKTAKVEKWYYHIFLPVGADVSTISYDTLEIRVQVDGGTEVSPVFTVKPGTNETGCQVVPNYLFYTTPQTPYDIQYNFTIQQKTYDLDGKIRTVMSGYGWPWDMDPNQPGRQTKAIWRFGVDTNAHGQFQHRNKQESYQ